jgi:polyhydroxyalkanoate synthase
MLQSNDLFWSHAIRDYLLGEHDAPFDLMAWNADGTRLPARMHIEYLRGLFLNNDLAEGGSRLAAARWCLSDIKLPMFVVGTERDHIAPWHSVFKLHLLNDGDLTFVLTSGGHNAGIVSEPGHASAFSDQYAQRRRAYAWPGSEWERDTRCRKGPGGWNGTPGLAGIPRSKSIRRHLWARRLAMRLARYVLEA